jgi:hypothetical protein
VIGTVSVLYVLLAAASVVIIDLRVVLIPSAILTLVLTSGGFVAFRHLRGALAIPWPAIPSAGEIQSTAIIEGTALPFQGYAQEAIVLIRIRRALELAAAAFLSVAALYAMFFLANEPSFASAVPTGVFQVEFICIAGLIVLIQSLRWFLERRFLARSRCTVGTILGGDPGFFRRSLTYGFFDQNGERRGGQGVWPLASQDNLVLVLYDPHDPDASMTQRGFHFHQFSVRLIPARNRKSDQ